MQPNRMSPAVLATLLALGVIWGGAFVLIKVLGEELSAGQLVAARLALGASVVAGIAAVWGQLTLPAPRGLVAIGALAALDNVVPNTLVAWSEQRIDSGSASVLMSTMPLFTAVFAVVLLGERASWPRVFGLALGLSGILLVSDADVLDVRSDRRVGMLAVMLASSSHAVAAIYTRVLSKRFEPLRLIAFKLVAGTALIAPPVLMTEGAGAYLHLSGTAVVAMIVLGVVATGAAYGAYMWVVKAAGPVQASLVTYLIPIAGLLLSWVALGESIDLHTVVGAGAIVAGVAAALLAHGGHGRDTNRQVPLTARAHGPAAGAPAG